MREIRKFGKLYIVATPIGNIDDISRRALEILNSVDLVLCEERKIGSRLLKQLGITKSIVEINEHNEPEMIQDVIVELMNGKNLALISDCGTPVFADPGRQLIRMMYEMRIPVVPIPGVSSLMTAISVCPFNLDQFLFIGFLPAKTEPRERSLGRLANADFPIILMDTPYRMGKLLQEISGLFGKKQPVFLAADLTLPGERLLQGSVEEVIKQVQGIKAEFILIMDKPQRRRV